MPLSKSTGVSIATILFGLIFIGFGVFDLIDPEAGLSFFEFQPSLVPSTRSEVNGLIRVIGIRDIFMGIAILATLYTGNRTVTGWILISASAAAFTDGVVCYQHGKGEWNHWGYAPALTITGTLLLGVLDGKEKRR